VEAAMLAAHIDSLTSHSITAGIATFDTVVSFEFAKIIIFTI
jgi:hypothetical protein